MGKAPKTEENSSTRSMNEIWNQFFDGNKNPALKAGYVSEQFQASANDLKAAEKLLAFRRKEYGWKKEALTEDVAEAIKGSWKSSERPVPDSIADHRPEGGEESENPVEPATARRDQLRALLNDAVAGEVMQRTLPFWQNGLLVHLHLKPAAVAASPENAVRFICGTGSEGRISCSMLDGTAGPIHHITRLVGFSPTRDGAIEEFISFFCEHVMAESGSFTLIEEGDGPSDLLFPEFYTRMNNMYRETELLSRAKAGSRLPKHRRKAQLAHPITRVENASAQEQPFFVATTTYAGFPFRAAFSVDEGSVSMLDDQPIPRVNMDELQLQWRGRTLIAE